MIRSLGSLLLLWLLPAAAVVHAQSAGIDTTTVAVDTIAERTVPGIRGVHVVFTTALVYMSAGIHADIDLLVDSELRPPAALGVRAGFEGASGAWENPFTAVDLLARGTMGGGSLEVSALAGYAWIREYHEAVWELQQPATVQTAILPKFGAEIRWMFVPKYAGLVLHITTTTEDHFSGGLGLVLGWQP